MSAIRFVAIATGEARYFQQGGEDAYGRKPERGTSGGGVMPCRHCLKDIRKGDDYLVLAYRPFPELQPYAETGPIFLHAEECSRAPAQDDTPAIFASVPDYIVRGYGADDRIVYGTGSVVVTGKVRERAAELLEREDIAYLHVRSARNNCYQCRIERAG